MSIFHVSSFNCPACGAENTVERSSSVNADVRPDFRAEILAGTFQAANCVKCGERLRVPPHLTFLELGRKTWIAVEPASSIDEWEAIEDRIWRTYARAFGEEAPPNARELAMGVMPRLVFGWPAFREKLICIDLGLDDVTLELLKIAIMRNVQAAPMADETELRLVGGSAEKLDFAWFHSISEERFAELSVPREIYDGIGADSESWAELREKFEQVFLVDLRRLIAGGPAMAEAAD